MKNDLRTALIAEAVKFEYKAALIRKVIATLQYEYEKTPAVAKRKAYDGPGIKRFGHTKRVCQYELCGRTFIGHADQKYCSIEHGWKGRAFMRKQDQETARTMVSPAKKVKPTTLIHGDNLSQR